MNVDISSFLISNTGIQILFWFIFIILIYIFLALMIIAIIYNDDY